MLYFDPCFKQLASLLFTNLKKSEGIHLAYQIDILDVGKPFYIEFTESGKINIEPYEYNDRDAKIRSSFDTLMKIITKQIKVEDVYKQNLLFIEGDIKKVQLLQTLFK